MIVLEHLLFPSGEHLRRHKEEALVRHLKTYWQLDDPLLATDKLGKPFLKNSSIYFNKSHSGPHLVIASTCRGALGVDLQLMDPSKDLPRLASKVLSPLELQEFERFKDPTTYFYQRWVLKEATSKAMGLGLQAGFHRMDFSGEGRRSFVHGKYHSKLLRAPAQTELALSLSTDWSTEDLKIFGHQSIMS